MSDVIHLVAGDATAAIALHGAEPFAWRVGGRDLLWDGDPAHWEFRAPILFPKVGASKGRVVQVGGVAYPMAQHGFARRSDFALVERAGDSVTLRLCDGPETRTHYPFAFTLDVTASLARDSLSLVFAVRNQGSEPMPYALGFHPAFRWPFDAPDRDGHAVVFAEPERHDLPEVGEGGLLARHRRTVPLDGNRLALTPELFSEALVFLDAQSRSFAFRSPSGAAIAMELEGFPHLAVWSRPTAPFLSLEGWSGHADWVDAEGELAERDSMTILAPGAVRHHRAVLRFVPSSS